MVYAMDTLGYAKRLRDAGIPLQQAEAHAEAARDFVMAELVTKSDLQSGEAAGRKDRRGDRGADASADGAAGRSDSGGYRNPYDNPKTDVTAYFSNIRGSHSDSAGR